ncbi:MAG: hypothetical protein HXY22_10005 [Alphaproteobacteria bacterium]|nr:hypothetical protein [Alphaproteobacteria bacterium]
MRHLAPGLMILAALASANAVAEGADALCAGRAGCILTAKTDAGTGAEGERLTIVELALPNEPDDDVSCQPARREIWLVGEKPGVPAATKKLQELCNDGYGAASVGEDDIAVTPNHLTHTQYGGSNWRWETVTELQLSPLEVLKSASCSYHVFGPGWQYNEWDLRAQKGRALARRLVCNAQGEPDLPEEEIAGGCVPGEETIAYSPIPRLYLGLPDETLLATQIVDCAATATSDGKDGFIVHGKPGAPDDATLKVIAIDEKSLWIAVTDDRLIEDGENWLYDDHLEIWVGDINEPLCDREDDKPSQFAIPLRKPQAIVASGPKTAAPVATSRVSVGQDGRVAASLIVRFEQMPNRITLVYSDSDDGKAQKRLIATSPVKFADRMSLGEFGYPGANAYRCAVRGGAFVREGAASLSVLPGGEEN